MSDAIKIENTLTYLRAQTAGIKENKSASVQTSKSTTLQNTQAASLLTGALAENHDTARLDSIRAKIQAGQYNVDHEALANKLIPSLYHQPIGID